MAVGLAEELLDVAEVHAAAQQMQGDARTEQVRVGRAPATTYSKTTVEELLDMRW